MNDEICFLRPKQKIFKVFFGVLCEISVPSASGCSAA